MKKITLIFIFLFIIQLGAHSGQVQDAVPGIIGVSDKDIPKIVINNLSKLKQMSDAIYKETIIDEPEVGYIKAFAITKIQTIANGTRTSFLITFISDYAIQKHLFYGTNLALMNDNGKILFHWPIPESSLKDEVENFDTESNGEIPYGLFNFNKETFIVINQKTAKYWGPYLLFYKFSNDTVHFVGKDYGVKIDLSSPIERQDSSQWYDRSDCYFDDFDYSKSVRFVNLQIHREIR